MNRILFSKNMTAAHDRYPHVFSPLSVNGARLKNRIVRTAHGTNYPGGYVNERLIAFHETRARGGVALTILEVASVHPTSPGRFVAYDDGAIDGYRQLTQRLAPYDMRVFQQLWHGGAHSLPADGTPAWAPSAVPSIEVGAVPIAMTKAMIDEIVGAYASTARRCEQGGLDGVEVHAAHGYLPSQFLSPLTNLRTDEYGGPLENRLRVVREILEAIRSEVSPTFAVGVRLSSTELVDGGLTVDDTAQIAGSLANAGLVDFVNFSIGSFYVGHTIVAPMHEPHGYQVPYAERISRGLDVPTIVAGRVLDLAEAEAILARGAADLISMVRATIADPDLVTKALEGREGEVRPCIGANQGCVGGMYGSRRRLGCDVNVDVGRESRIEPLAPADAPRRVLVAGAGPAGMETARIAALRGHEVVVHEARPDVGGATSLARRAPFSSDFGRFCDWQARELRRLGVAIHLDSEVDAELVARATPDAVVVATGGLPRRDGFQLHDPDKIVRGTELELVFTVVEALSDRLGGRRRVLVFDDLGRYEAVAAAEYLLERGAEVTFATTLPTLGEHLAIHFRRVPATERLFAHDDFRLLTRIELDAIEPARVVLRDRDGGAVREEAADAVVLVSRAAADGRLADELAPTFEVHVVGDAASPRDLAAAVADGNRVGRVV